MRGQGAAYARGGSARCLGPPPRAAVVLLHHADYARRYLEPCYASLARQTYPRAQFDVFIVGNGVSGEARTFIARVAPDTRILENPDNLGWGAGNNQAIAVALAEGVPYLVLLNIDTVVEPEWLEALVRAAEQHPTLHILQSKILLDGTGRINSVGNRIQYLGYGYCNGYGRVDAPGPSGFPIDYASGTSMLVKREVFERIGLFREDYLLYYDDMEFCWRARLSGFNVGLAEASVCHHKYDFSTRLPWLYYYQRNRWLTLLTLERLGTLAVIAPCLLLSEVVLGGVLMARGFGATWWSVLRYFTRRATWRSIRKRRRQVRALRVRRDAEIVARFAGPIVFAELNHPALRYVANPLLRLYWAIARRLIRW